MQQVVTLQLQQMDQFHAGIIQDSLAMQHQLLELQRQQAQHRLDDLTLVLEQVTGQTPLQEMPVAI
jgi:hypothetical protein